MDRVKTSIGRVVEAEEKHQEEETVESERHMMMIVSVLTGREAGAVVLDSMGRKKGG